MQGQTVHILNEDFILESLLGRGKAAYSWLAVSGNRQVVYKKMHTEPVPYYTFSNKVLSEVDAWKRLTDAGIHMPELLEWNDDQQYLVKEYIPGKTAAELAAQGLLQDQHFMLAWKFNRTLASAGLHVDYFPTNFIVTDTEILYIDYECHPYNSEWDFENWGIYYWLNSAGLKTLLETGTCDTLNYPGTPKPVREPFEAAKQAILGRVSSGYL